MVQEALKPSNRSLQRFMHEAGHLQGSEHLPHPPPKFRQVEGLVDAALLARTLVVRFRS